MGIKGLSKLLEQEGLLKKINIKSLAHKKIAIDISILLYQIVISIRNSGDDIRNNKGEVISHILGLFNKTIFLIQNKITPIFIFDGKPPDFKNNTINNRKKIRSNAEEKYKETKDEKERIKYFKRSTHITSEQIEQSKELLDLMGVPYLQADGEADILCAKLSEEGYVDYVYTEDMDILTFGASKIIKNLFTKGSKNIYVIDKLAILKKFDLTYNQFVIFCIFLGCDYHSLKCTLDKTKILNIVKSYEFFSDFTFDNKKLDSEKIKNIFNYFTSKLELEDINIKIKNPSSDLQNVLVKRYNLQKQKISYKINILKKQSL